MESNNSLNLKKNKTTKQFDIKCVVGAVLAVLMLAGIFYYMNNPKREVEKQLILGDRYLSELDYENAAMAFTKAIQIDPMNQTLISRLETTYDSWSDALSKAGEYELALQRISEAKGIIGDTDILKEVELNILIELTNIYVGNGEFAKAYEIIERINAIDSQLADNLRKETENSEGEYIVAQNQNKLREYQYLISMSKEALGSSKPPNNKEGTPYTLYISFSEARESFKELINGLENYIALIEELQIKELFNIKYEMGMGDTPAFSADTVHVGEINAITLCSAYNMLIKCYLRIGDMDNAYRIRCKLADLIDDKSILDVHTKGNNVLDKYGRPIEYNDNTQHIEITYTDGLCPVRKESEDFSYGKSITKYEYVDGRLSRQSWEFHRNDGFWEKASIDYSYGHGIVYENYSTMYSDGSGGTESSYSVDKYGERHEL